MTTPPTSTTRNVYGQPDFKPTATPGEIADLAQESGCPPQPDPASAGWDISSGCRLNYGRDVAGNLEVDIQLGPDYDGTGVIRRTVTPAQLVEHAQHLLRVARDEINTDKRMIMAFAMCDIDTAIACCQTTAQRLRYGQQARDGIASNA